MKKDMILHNLCTLYLHEQLNEYALRRFCSEWANPPSTLFSKNLIYLNFQVMQQISNNAAEK